MRNLATVVGKSHISYGLVFEGRFIAKDVSLLFFIFAFQLASHCRFRED